MRLTRCERPHRLTQKRPLTLVSVVQSPAAVEIANIRLSRDLTMETNLKVHDEALAAQSRPAPCMIPDQERRSSVAKAEASATHPFGLESGGQSGRATKGLPPLCTVGAAEFAPPASGRTALFSTAIEFVVFSSPLPDVADPVVVQLVSGFSLEGVVDCAAAGPMTNVPTRIAAAARSIFVSMTENRLLNSI